MSTKVKGFGQSHDARFANEIGLVLGAAFKRERQRYALRFLALWVAVLAALVLAILR